MKFSPVKSDPKENEVSLMFQGKPNLKRRPSSLLTLFRQFLHPRGWRKLGSQQKQTRSKQNREPWRLHRARGVIPVDRSLGVGLGDSRAKTSRRSSDKILWAKDLGKEFRKLKHCSSVHLTFSESR